MKKILLSFCLMLASVLAWANPVTYETAMKVAESFATSQGISIEANPVVNLTPEGMFRQMYVFGFDGAKGFVIVAADDRVTPILGYSLEDDFSSADMPTDVYECFKDYSDQIDSLVANDIEPTDQIVQTWKSITAIEPSVIDTSAVHPILSDGYYAIGDKNQASGNTSHHINVNKSVILAINPRIGSENTYTQITAVPDDPIHGYVSGSGYYKPGNTATLKAIPKKGYVFSHWDDHNTSNPRYVFVNSYSKSYIAFFTTQVAPPPGDRTDSSNAPLCFTARNGSVTVRFDIINVTHQIKYSTDGTTWYNYTSNSSVTISANQSIYFRAATTQTTATAFSGSRFYFASNNGGVVEGSGNIMSLYGPNCPNLALQPFAFFDMFHGCTSLIKAPSLPATTLAEGCYLSMFYGCHSLTSPPSLPATTLAENCYQNMFGFCTSLTSSPSLPATTLSTNCYNSMFYGCTSLTTIPSLPATTLKHRCYAEMFYDCTSLVVNISGSGETWNIPATATASYALDNMFYGTGGTMNRTPSVNTTYYVTSGCSVLRAKENDVITDGVTVDGIMGNVATDIISATPSMSDGLENWSNGVTETVAPAEAFVSINLLNIENLAVGTHVTVIDAQGRTLYDNDAYNMHIEFELPTRGVYMVVLSGTQEQIIKLVY